MSPRSYLFVPADRPERYAKALASGADAVIVDLEDAVAAGAKDGARAALAAWLDGGGSGIAVRINDAASAAFDDDLRLVARAGVAAVVVPKAERTDDLARVRAAAPAVALLPLIETAAGIARAREIASAPGVQRLAFGSIDLQLDLGIEGDGDELLAFRSELVLASRLAALDAPVDGVSTAMTTPRRSTPTRGARAGSASAPSLHPSAPYRCSACGVRARRRRVAWAERVVAAAARAGGGAVAVDGKMVDRPVLLRAEALLARRG